MLYTLHRIKKLSGIDRAISYILMGKIVALGIQPLTLFLVGKYLSLVEQGFYFTFSNILSLSVFFELGLGTILTQFASYEFASLEWKNNRVHGQPIALDRLFSLIKQSMRWYGMVALIFMAVIIPAGIFFFSGNAISGNVQFIVPWIILVIATALNLVCYALTSLLEGCKKVEDVQLIKLTQAMMAGITICGLLYARFGLYASAGFALAQFLVIFCWLNWKYKGFIKQVRDYTSLTSAHVSWKKEILPLQWRIGLSWIAGYIIFQTINPAIFKFRGPVEAGQMGMTIAIASLPATVGMAWLTAKIPLYGSLIQSGQNAKLLSMVKQNTLRAVVISLLGAIAIIVVLKLILSGSSFFKNRMLSLQALSFLLAYNILNLVINSMAAYIRAFKIEPFMKSSLFIALVTGVNVYVCAAYFSGSVLCLSLLLQCLLVNFPVSYFIFNRYQYKFNVKTANHLHSHVQPL